MVTEVAVVLVASFVGCCCSCRRGSTAFFHSTNIERLQLEHRMHQNPSA